MIKRLALILVLMVILIFPSPASAFKDYVDGVTTYEEILDYTLQHHIDRPNLSDLVNGSIDAVLKQLNDPYTEYMTPESLKNFTNSLNADYVGIGIKMESTNGYPKVVTIFTGSPAERAKLQVSDLIIAVDGEDVKDLPLSIIVQKIRGIEGSKVTLTINRNNQIFDVSIIREAVNAPTVTYEVMFDNIGYIDVNSFGNDTDVLFATALQNLKTQQVKGIILDLRGNSGGYLTSAVNMMGNFLPADTKVVGIVDNKDETTVYRSYGNGIAAGMPMAILVDKNTASASEIVAGAFQDYGIGTLVGSPTYGKGSVQTIFNLHNGGALKLTIARYQLPSGRFIDGIGLTPDRLVRSPGLELHAARQILQPADKKQVEFIVGSLGAKVNGVDVRLQYAPFTKDGIYYIPLRFTMEALGYTVGWDDRRNGIKMIGNNEEKFIPAVGGTHYPVQVINGLSYVSTTDLKKLGLQFNLINQSILIKKD